MKPMRNIILIFSSIKFGKKKKGKNSNLERIMVGKQKLIERKIKQRLFLNKD